MKFISHSAKETIDFAQRFSKILRQGDILCLRGNLGAGKTTFVKGLASGLKIKKSVVTSPTFVLMNVYEGKIPVYHFDLYRIEGVELERLGYEEFFYGEGVAVIEWAERLKAAMPKEYFSVVFKHGGDDLRVLTIKARGKSHRQRLKNRDSAFLGTVPNYF